MITSRVLLFFYFCISVLFLVYSYGFVDRNLTLSTNQIYSVVHQPLHHLVFERRGWAGGIYVSILIVLWILYALVLRNIEKKIISALQLKQIILTVSVIFIFSYPAFSYDIFNYMLTARVAFNHKENPWIVRPIEIPNESALAYTRAANKVALYGPTWILLTYIPHAFGLGNVWLTILTFKLFVALFYYLFLFLLWKITKNCWNVAFFALNPLALITILNEGHNDIVMMTLACASLLIVRKEWKPFFSAGSGIVLYFLSIFIKGATIALLPVFLLKKSANIVFWSVAYCLMFIVFLISPFREEMYPWYFVWCLSCLAFMLKKNTILYKFTFALCFGLLLRNVPYIVTRQYEGYNQLIRTLVTWAPVVFLFLISIWKSFSGRKRV